MPCDAPFTLWALLPFSLFGAFSLDSAATMLRVRRRSFLGRSRFSSFGKSYRRCPGCGLAFFCSALYPSDLRPTSFRISFALPPYGFAWNSGPDPTVLLRCRGFRATIPFSFARFSIALVIPFPQDFRPLVLVDFWRLYMVRSLRGSCDHVGASPLV